MSRIAYFLILLSACFSSCTIGSDNPNKDITLEAFSGFKDNNLFIDGDSIRAYIAGMMRADGQSLPSDRYVHKYYGGGKPFMWISYGGVTASADTLLRYLSTADESGISPRLFRMEQIAADLETVRTLDMNGGSRPINRILAWLEYNLTRSYLRYISCQHFGFINPNTLYNRLDTLSNDSSGLKCSMVII